MDLLQLEGIKNLLIFLDTFLNNMSIASFNVDESFVWLYKNAILQSINIIYANLSYNNTL